jgi:predicted Zn finger-like uncharacterized protein
MSSLATRCTACGTVFRIVEDQLRVSDGWVRCGRCTEVFDARALLFDIERDAPPTWPAPLITPTAAAEVPPPAAPPAAPEPEAAPALGFVASSWAPDSQMPEPEISVAPPTDWGVPPADRREPHWVDEGRSVRPGPTPAPPEAVDSMGPASSLMAEPGASTLEMPVPEFMRRAEQSERWRRPWVRATLGVTAVLLALLLSLQITMHFRDALAALHPPLRESLVALCRTAGCEVQPWRRIEALSIDSTSLSPVGSSNSYKLSLSLRNKTGVDVAAPWIELSLTDANGDPFARRVLGPEALSPALKQVNAESEQALSLVFSTGSQRVSGYSVNIFYP